jgi:hypothetical protein
VEVTRELVKKAFVAALVALSAFVKSVFVVLIVEATKELVKKAFVTALVALSAFAKSVFVVLIVEATRELVKKAFVLRNAGVVAAVTEDIYPIVPRPLRVD